MLKIGITGGIGSGKSTVCKVFTVLGIPVYHADDMAKDLIRRIPEIRNNIMDEFGEESFSDGRYNAKYISEIVFGNKENLQKLNSIVHPYVEKNFRQWCADQSGTKYILEEAAILFESRADKFLDYTIVVNAPLPLRIQRIMERDRITEEMVMNRMHSQWPTEKILPLADWIVENDEKHLLLPQILSIHNQLIS
jgi:dephospho-CoA kinase